MLDEQGHDSSECASPSSNATLFAMGVIIAKYFVGGREYLVRHDEPAAHLPVLMRDGTIALVQWGYRGSEEEEEAFEMLFDHHPRGFYPGAEIQRPKINLLIPDARPVKIPLHSYHGPNWLGNVEWNQLKEGEAVQGAMMQRNGERRVYVVMEPGDKRTWLPRVVPITAPSRRKR